MEKQKIVNYLKIGILLIGVSFLLLNCEKVIDNDINTEKFNIQAKFKKKSISFLDFKNNITAFKYLKNKIEIDNRPKNFKKKFNNFDYISYVDSSRVIYFKEKDLKTYTFPVITKLDKEENDFFNLIIKDNKGVLSAHVIKYIPEYSNHNLKENEFIGGVEVFNGQGKRISKGYIENLENIGSKQSKKHLGKTSESDDCIPKIEPVYGKCGCGGNADGHEATECPSCFGSPLEGYNITICPNSGSDDINQDLSNWQDDLDILHDNTPELNDSSFGGDPTNSNTPTSPTSLGELTNVIDTFIGYGIILTYKEAEWLLENPVEKQKFVNYLNSNNSFEAQNWVKGQIELETIKTKKITTHYSPGKINGRNDLSYTHIGSDGAKTVYRLTNGDVIVSSNTKLVINNYENGFWKSEVSNQNYWYIKVKDTGDWAQLLINEHHTSLADDLRRLFVLGAKDLTKMLGTYVIPIEDFKILFTGKDFNGQPTSRWLGAGMLLMEVIPGGKLLKPLVKTSKLIITPLKIAVKEGGGYVVKTLGKAVNVEVTTSVFNDMVQYLSTTGVELARVTNNVLTISKHKIKAKTGSLLFKKADEINAEFIAANLKGPYKIGSTITEVITKEPEEFVRVFTEGVTLPNGRWMVKKSEIAHIINNPAAIQDYLALPANMLPNKIVTVKIPANTRLRIGTAGPNFNKNGGALQIELPYPDFVDPSWFTNITDL